MSSTAHQDTTTSSTYVSDHEKDFISIDANGMRSNHEETQANGSSQTHRNSTHAAQSSLTTLSNAITSVLSLGGLTGATPTDVNSATSATSNNNSTNFQYPSKTSQTNSNNNNSNNSNSNTNATQQYPYEWRTIIFIRHGNSIWNESTDNASLLKPTQTVKALKAFTTGVKEYATYKWKGDDYKLEDSMIVDTPLSPKGMRQAYLLSKYLAGHIDLRQNQKLKYLEEHQSIASPIKDAWRLLQQCKSEMNGKNGEKEFPNMCNDALTYLTDAMHKLEILMAHAPPVEPEYWNFKALEEKAKYGMENENSIESNNNNKIGNGMEKQIPSNHSRSKSLRNIIEPHNPHTAMDNNAQFDIGSILDLLAGKNIKSIIVTSNLRRAISTCVIGLWPRLRLTREKAECHFFCCVLFRFFFFCTRVFAQAKAHRY